MKALNYVKMRKLLEELKEEDPTVTVVRDEKGKKVSNTTISPAIPRQERVRQFIEDPTIITNYRTPVKRKVNVIEDDDDDKKWYQELFQAADSFKDKKGNILTDTIGTILGTTADVGLGAVKGIAQVGEEFGALLSGGIAQGADILGADNYADKVRKNIADGKHHVISNILKKGQDAIDDYSVIGDTGDKVTEGVGQLASFYATGGVGMFASGAGGSLEESYQKEDVEDWQVWTKAVGTGAISFATEKLGGFFGKSTSLDNKLANVAAQKMANGMAKIFTRSTIQATAEAGEEALEYAGNQLLDLGIDKFTEATGSNGAKFKEDWDWEAFGEQVAVGFLTSKAASTGLNVSNVASTKAKNNISTKEAINEVAKQQDRAAGMLTKSEQQAIDSIVNERVKEIQKQNTLENELKTAIENRETSQGGILSAKNKNALRKSILTKIESGEIDTSSTKVSKKELSKIQEEVKKNLSEGKYDLSKLEDILTPTETAKIKELEQSLANTKDNTQKAQIQAQIKKLKTSKLSSLKNMVNDNQYLNKAVYETEMSNQKYSYDETTVTDEYEKGTRESAKSYLNNTTVSRNFVDNIAKLAKDRQTNYKFTNNKELLEQGDLVENTNLTKEEKALIQDLEKQLSNATTEAQKRNIQNQIDEIKYYDVGGFVRKNVDGVETVLINVDSKQSLNAVVGHETKHLLEKNSLNKEYNKLLFEYAKTKGDYDTYKKRIERLYEGVDNANIENELSAALTGDYLFTDSKFIETLLNDKNANSPKIIQKIRELIDDLVVRFKGTDQEKQLREVQKKFKELYKQNATDTNVATKETKTQYSLISDNANKTYIQDINKTRAEMMKKQNKSDTEIWLATGYQYNEEIGKWQTEVTDPKFKSDTKVEVGKEYRLEDVIDAEELFNAYPQLREVTFERTDFSDIAETQEELEAMRKKVKGSTTQDGKIVINENVKSKKLAGEILTHEIQHLIQEIEGYDTDHSVYFMQDEKGKVYISKEYLNDPTEKEARQVQNRNMMTEDERANIVPKNTSNKVDFNRYSLSNTKVSKQYLERQFKELTGESIQRADAILGGIEVRNNMRKEGNRTDALESIPYSDEAMEIYKTYKNSRKSSNALYHTTSKDNLQSILANGLTTNNQARQEGVSGKGKLYLAADEQLASSFGEDTDILLRIDPKYNLENLESDLLGGEGTYSTTNNIPVSALQVKENGKWVKLEKSQLSKQNTQYSLTDNKGRELSKEQQEKFKNSKVLDKDGNLLTMYHGTGTNFTVFDKSKVGSNYEDGWSAYGRGFYFTSDNSVATEYSKEAEGTAQVKEVYLNVENPFYANESYPELFEQYNLYSPLNQTGREFIRLINSRDGRDASTNILRTLGYDGIVENFGEGIDEVVVFESNQIKNTDNTNPTDSKDIRYSISDNQGRTLTKKQQEFFKDVSSELKDENGNLKTLYHGSNSEFTIFDINKSGESNKAAKVGFWFTESKQGAENFTNSTWYGENNPTTYESYLNIKNPKVYESKDNSQKIEEINKQIKNIEKDREILKDKYEYGKASFKFVETLKEVYRKPAETILKEKGYNESQIKEYIDDLNEYNSLYKEIKKLETERMDLHYGDSYEQFRTDIYKLAGQTAEDANLGGIGMALNNQNEVMKRFRQNLIDEGYDGIVIKNTRFDTDTLGAGNNQYVAFYPEQIKNVDNTNPTSNPDIRYSLSDTNNHKEQQLDIVLKNNPVEDDYHTWIRSVEDIKTFEETLQDSDWVDYVEEGFNPDYTGEMVKEAQETGKITVYSSYPIKQGIFVSPSRMEAESYSMDGKVYSKEVNLTDVAWIDPTQGQYAKVPESKLSLSNPNEDIGPVGDYNVYGKDIKYYDLPFEDNVNAYRDAFDQSVRESIEGVERELGRRPQDPTKESSYDNPTSAREWKEKAKKRSIEQKVEDTIRKHSYKNAASTSMLGRRLLDFNEQERRTFRDSLLGMTSKTREQLINADTYNNVRNIINQYANREYNFIDEELASAKRDVRSYRIKLDDYVKKQITDYDYFRKSNFGTLTIAKDGMSIDSVWQELSMSYPYYFSEDVTSEADMLYALSDFMQRDITITEKYRLSDNDIEDITKKIYNKIVHNALSQQDLEFAEQDIADQVERRTRQVVQNELLEEMGITDDVLMNAKKISQPDLMRTDPIRVNEKIFGWKNGQIINDATINTTIKHEAERVRFLNQERNEIKSLGIKPRSKESAAVQKYAEKQYVNKFGEVVPYTDKELVAEFKDPKTQVKIKRAAQILRRKYDTYIDIVNNELERMGYDPIPKRKDYMRHFQEMTDIFSRLGTPLNPTSLNEENLPTDINGLTDEFKPGKSWFANAQKRKGMKTVYDAITGIDGYLDSVSNVIYHTEDIQRYRTLSKHIRTMFSDKALEDYDVLREEDKIEAFNNAYKGQQGYLAQYVAWLDEQANALAGKKGKIDRGIEEVFGRKVYTALNDAKKQVGSNMTGFNVRSAMTNFASAINGMSKTKKIAFAKGTLSTFNNIIKDDGLIDKSNFLTTRFGSEQLSKKAWQKVSNYGQIFMTGSDYFTANQIWRSKYFENIDSGMSESDAIKNADDFAARIMGNRAKGTTAQIFNSKTLGLFTQFQLEVNNQWSSLIHDNQMEIEKGKIEGKTAKATASVIFNLGQLAIFSNIFNTLMTSLTGSDVMIDPIELFKTLTGDDDEEKETLSTRVTKAIGEVINDLPFASTFTGGRIPISEAFGGVQTLTKKLTGQTDEYGNEYEWSDVWNDMFESGMYWVLPTGYNQMKKTKQGLGMFDDDLPIAGSYTDSGNLRFTVDDSLESKIKAGLFGQWANEEAQEYIDSGFKSIRKNSIQELKDLGMKSSEYRILKSNINASGKTNEDKVNFITDLDELTDSQKNTLVNNILDRDYDVDVSNYDAYSSYEEFDFSYKSPEKYAFLVENNISYKDYVSSDESKEAYNWAFNNPEKYSVAKTITDDMVEYKRYTSEISDITADKDENGKSISGSRKEKIIDYVNSLNLSIAQKAIMIRKEYPSYDDYNNEIVDYVIGLEIDETEKNIILEELDMRVDSEGYVWW